jgi:choline kinase
MDKKQNLINNHSAIFLLAGSGNRIAKLTKEPKCLLKINNQTIIDRNFRILKKLNIKKIILVLGFKKNLIKKKIIKHKNDFDIKYVYNDDYVKKGNSYSLLKGLKKANSESLIFDGDLVFSEKILQNFLKSKQKSSFLVGKTSIKNAECAKVLVDEFGYIRKTIDKRLIKRKELKDLKFIGEAIGIIKIENVVRKKMIQGLEKFLSIKKNLHLNWEHFMNMFFEDHDIKFKKTINSQWVEIDTKEDYNLAQTLFRKND